MHTVQRRFLGLGAAHGVLLLLLAWWLAPIGEGSAILAALAVFCIGLIVATALMRASYAHARLGPANAVTQLRAALATVLVVPLVLPGMLAGSSADAVTAAWAVLAIAAFTLSLDGIDGWLARRSGLASRFGARFDMEVDALFGFVLSVLAYQNGKAGAWVLALGLMRYVFVLAGWLMPWLAAPLDDSFRRKLVCVVQIGTLVLLLAPIVTPPHSAWLAMVATLLLVWSFAVDIMWLARRRPA